jgi:hypothetical protein
MDETMEEDVVEEIKEEYIQEPVAVDNSDGALTGVTTATTGGNSISQNEENNGSTSKLSFSDVDLVKDQFNNEERINAPKDIQRLEAISEFRNNQRRLESEEDESENQRLQISDESVNLDSLDVHVIGEPELETLPDLIIDDIELLD